VPIFRKGGRKIFLEKKKRGGDGTHVRPRLSTGTEKEKKGAAIFNLNREKRKRRNLCLHPNGEREKRKEHCKKGEKGNT